MRLCISFLFLKGIFIENEPQDGFSVEFKAITSTEAGLEFLVLTVYCFRDWVSVFGFHFLNFNEMIGRRARKHSLL